MDRYDGYIRLRPRQPGLSRRSLPPSNAESLLFIDVEGLKLEVGDVREAFREIPRRLSTTRYVLLRWPRITAAADSIEEGVLDSQANDLVNAMGTAADDLGLSQIYVGIVRFRVGAEPIVYWAGSAAPSIAEPVLLKRALSAELQALLDWGHAVWKPTGYHYELPSGDHAGEFVRVADAFRTPRDVRVLSSWLSARLRDGLGFVADSATMIPLITDLHAVMRKRDWRPGVTELLDEYPRTRLDALRVAQSVQKSEGGVLGLMSVSSSGRFRDLMMDALESTAPSETHWSMVVLVEKQSGSTMPTAFLAEAQGKGHERVDSWLALGGETDINPLDDTKCRYCRSNERAQLVKIDPRSFEALLFPGVDLITPDVGHARNALSFWQACDAAEAVGVELLPADKPSSISRVKNEPMAIRIDFDALLRPEKSDSLVDSVKARIRQLRDGPDTDGVNAPIRYSKKIDGILISEDDRSETLERVLLPVLKAELGLEDAVVSYTDLKGEPPTEVSQWKRALTFSLGSVTGWNMRQLQLQIEHAWRGRRGRELYGLVLHARPSSAREWTSLGRPYRNQLRALWLTYLPWRSPLLEELTHLNSLTRADRSELSEAAVEFRVERRKYCSPRERRSWSRRVDRFRADETGADPFSLLWGSPPRGGHGQVRTESNFGFEVGVVTAYAAMGAAVHAARQAARTDDPRQRVFEMPAISRAYYDGILLAAVLRWCEPQEVWWGASQREAENTMAELLARTRDPGDQKVLFPELLLAASMGKVAARASRRLLDEVATVSAAWPALDRGPIELGATLLISSRRKMPDSE